MKKRFLPCACSLFVPVMLCCASSVMHAAAVQEEDVTEPFLSTDTLKSDYGAEDEETQAQIQESDEDLVGFVEDYIKKDIILKGAFLLEDVSAKKILKLQLDSVIEKVEDGADNSKVVRTAFKDSAGKKYGVLFHLQSAGFSGVDIFRIELKKENKPNPAAKK